MDTHVMCSYTARTWHSYIWYISSDFRYPFLLLRDPSSFSEMCWKCENKAITNKFLTNNNAAASFLISTEKQKPTEIIVKWFITHSHKYTHETEKYERYCTNICYALCIVHHHWCSYYTNKCALVQMNDDYRRLKMFYI